MNESDRNLRALATKTLAVIAELYPHSTIAKKLDGEDSQEAYEIMISTWISALRGKPASSVQRGLDTLLNAGGTFEPSVPEFLAMCKPPPASHREYRALPKPAHNTSPARIDHYPKAIKDELIRIGMTPNKGENQHDYAMRCAEYTRSKHGQFSGMVPA